MSAHFALTLIHTHTSFHTLAPILSLIFICICTLTNRLVFILIPTFVHPLILTLVLTFRLAFMPCVNCFY